MFRLMAASVLVALSLGSCQGSAASSTPSAVTDIDRYIAHEVQLQSFSGTVLLAQNGKDSVCSYIGGCPATWKSISIQNLLTHTSGIPDYGRSLSQAPRLPSEHLLHYIERQPLDFTPGSQFSYSNSGYAVLGSVIENVTGESYADFLQREILSPLRLADTGYLDTSPPSVPVPRLATGYSGMWVKAAPSAAAPLFAAGSLYSTTEDLYRWDSALFNRTFASQDSLMQMFTAQVTYCGSAGTVCNESQCVAEGASCYSYGYGWFLQKQAFGTTLVPSDWHNGLVPGFAAYNSYYPDQKLTLIMLSNLDSSANYEPAMAGAIVAKMIRGPS